VTNIFKNFLFFAASEVFHFAEMLKHTYSGGSFAFWMIPFGNGWQASPVISFSCE
jgi:hypothetical protein